MCCLVSTVLSSLLPQWFWALHWKRIFYKMYFFYSKQHQVSWQSEWIANVVFGDLLKLHKMRNASSLPRLDDVIETIEDLQSNPSSRRTTYRYVNVIFNFENIKRTSKQLWIYYHFYWLIGHLQKVYYCNLIPYHDIVYQKFLAMFFQSVSK